MRYSKDSKVRQITIEEYNRRMGQLNRFHRMQGPLVPPRYWKWTKAGKKKFRQWWRVWVRVRDGCRHADECVRVCGPATQS